MKKKKKLENVMPRQCLMMMLNMITCIYYTKDRTKRRENSALAWHQLKEFKTTTFKNFVKPDLDDVPSSSFIVVVFSSQVKGRLLLLLLFEWPSSCNEWIEAENWLFVVVWKGNSKSSLSFNLTIGPLFRLLQFLIISHEPKRKTPTKTNVIETCKVLII